MGKYLQDLRFVVECENGLKTFSEAQRNAQGICNLIEVLFNFYLPKKIVVGENIWGITVHLTTDLTKDPIIKELGLRIDCFLHCDFNALQELPVLIQKKLLLDLFLRGLNLCVAQNITCFEKFKDIYDLLLKRDILYYDYHKERKISPNKEFSAQLKGFYSEKYEDRKIYLSVFNKENLELKSILIGNFNFQSFDRIKWANNKEVFAFHVNSIQSYKSKKVADDYFSIDIESEEVTYNPVTKESMFDYGVQLLTETNEFEKAMILLTKVRELGHGKVDNIFKNLEINPFERNKAILLQAPKKK